MKKYFLTLVFISLLAGIDQALFARDMTFDSSVTKINNLTQNEKPMNNTTLVILALTTLLAFSFQAVVGQQDISRPAQTELDEIAEVKKELDDGVMNKSNYEAIGWKRRLVEFSLKPQDRKARFDKNEDNFNATERKVLEAAYSGLAKSAAKQGISYEEPLDPVLAFLHQQLVETKASVDNFQPDDLFMVDGIQGDWLMRAISKKEYQKWIADSKINWANFPPVNKQRFDEVFAGLRASAAKKIPTFKPVAKNFTNHNATDETLMKKELDDPSKIKIHQIGLAQKDWEVQKNELDVPQKRFKAGYIWGKDSRDDFAYCRLYQVNIIQDYQGGGKYGASYSVLLKSWVVGCP